MGKVVRTINPGKIFEQEFKESVPKDVWLFRIKDPAQSFGNGAGTRFQPKNEFDFLMFKTPVLYALELKSTKGTQFQWSLTENKKMIKASQIESLKNVNQFPNTVQGFLFNFRKTEHTYFMHITDFDKFISETTKVSINEKDVVKYCGVLLPQKKKRVRYIYDITQVLDCQGSEGNVEDSSIC